MIRHKVSKIFASVLCIVNGWDSSWKMDMAIDSYYVSFVFYRYMIMLPSLQVVWLFGAADKRSQ